MNQFRPRLTEGEIQFIVHSLVTLQESLESQRNEVQVCEGRVARLRRELHYNSMVYKDLKLAKEQLAQAKATAQGNYYQSVICRSLLRRLRAMGNGKKLHTSSYALSCLNKILEPKTSQ